MPGAWTVQPDFFIVGAPKAGTTWLYRNLALNPGVFLTANKEPRYYSVEEGAELSFHGPGDAGWMSHFVRSREEYEALYAAAGEDQLCGEASSDYLYRAHVAAPRIRAAAPNALIVVLLRNPVDRAYSNWLHHARDGRETLSFSAALASEEERIESGWAWWWHYTGRGFYAEQLDHFFAHFPADRILLATHDELRRDPAGLLERVCEFLGVPSVGGEGVAEPRNQSLLPRSRTALATRRVVRPNAVSRAVLPRRARTALRHGVNWMTLHRPALTEAERGRLQRVYATDLRRLSRIEGLDVSGWLE